MVKKVLLIIGLIFCILSVSLAQDDPPPPPPEECDPDYELCDEPAALDDGIILLLVAGILYGIKRIKPGDS